jgi:1-acyl-sn-glycerol-3-phosphate acyltransferase
MEKTLYRAVFLLTFTIFKLIFRVLKIKISIENIDRLKNTTEAHRLIATNHTSYLDPVVIGYIYYLYTRKLPIYILKRELASNWLTHFIFIRFMGNIPVNRKNVSIAVFRKINKVLDSNDVIIFPQGTLREERLIDIEHSPSGIGFMAKYYKKNVLPIVHIGCDKILPTYGKPALFSKKWRIVKVKVLESITIEKGESHQALSQRIMQEMNKALLEI